MVWEMGEDEMVGIWLLMVGRFWVKFFFMGDFG